MKNTSDQNSNLFRQSSTTYFFSSLFFPPQLQKEITTLYAFVRTADNFVDQVPADKKNFVEFQKQALQALQNKKVKIPIITTFVTQAQKYHFKTEWVTAFLKAMAADLTVKNYKNLPLLQGYMYGSASVIGLMIARLLNLPAQAFPFADLLGQAMQLTNFIRDIQEDLSLGRVYLPQEDRQKFGVKHLPPQTVQQKKQFEKLIQFEVRRNIQWYQQAQEGFHYLPLRPRIAIQTATDLYLWALRRIARQPMIVFERKVKPSKWRVLFTGLCNSIQLSFLCMITD